MPLPKSKSQPPTRRLTVIAQDPGVKSGRRILRTTVDLPAEDLEVGPWGHRVQVVDYDVPRDFFVRPLPKRDYALTKGQFRDPWAGATDAQLVNDPRFHAQNVYALVMQTLTRFERALGRPISWPFESHHLKVAPHGIAEANAYYQRSEEALVFGYFPKADRPKELVQTSLSHDVVVHETTHALLDSMRTHFAAPASPDQAAFHEGFADVVALLSVCAVKDIAERLLDLAFRKRGGAPRLLTQREIRVHTLRESGLLGLAEEMGRELGGVRVNALRESAKLERSTRYYNDAQRYPEYQEAHKRGEILVAAMLDAFLRVWCNRFPEKATRISLQHFVGEGVEVANYLLTMAIRAIDYTPPLYLEFGDFLSALLTADVELRPAEVKFAYRDQLLESFRAFGIEPSSNADRPFPGVWKRGEFTGELDYERTHFEQMTRDPDEVFEFIWHNAAALAVPREAYGRVLSVRPCQRVAPNGAVLHETVAEFYQVLKLRADELGRYGVKAPRGMPKTTPVSLRGGCTLIFDEYGRVKYNVHNRITNVARQNRRLKYLWESGFYGPEGERSPAFRDLHRERAGFANQRNQVAEEW